MNPRRLLSATFWATVFVQTLGSIDIGQKKTKEETVTKRKLPPPKAYVAIVVVWALLGWVAQVSDNLARAAATLSGLMLVTTLFVNATHSERYTVAGTRLIHFFNAVSDKFSIQPPTQGGASEPLPPPDEGSFI